MPLVQIKGISGYLSLQQKQDIIRKVTDAIVSVEAIRRRYFGSMGCRR